MRIAFDRSVSSAACAGMCLLTHDGSALPAALLLESRPPQPTPATDPRNRPPERDPGMRHLIREY